MKKLYNLSNCQFVTLTLQEPSYSYTEIEKGFREREREIEMKQERETEMLLEFLSNLDLKSRYRQFLHNVYFR